MNVTRHITLPKGFRSAGVACGMKPSGSEGLAIVAADRDASVAIVTTQNQIVGAPILWCRQMFPRRYGKARAIVINAGNANVCTGKVGLHDAQTMATETAKCLGSRPDKILVASTGIIGRPLPMTRVRRGIAAAAESLSTRNDQVALRAIMTTDTRAKSAIVKTQIGRKKVTIAGIVKGAGMVAPSLATMIGVLTTDAAISPPALKKALFTAVGPTFNAITIDSDTSTSDMVAILASGAAANKVIFTGSPGHRKLTSAVTEVCAKLARAVVADGEGATKLIEVIVRGARSNREAEIAAKSVANSPLFKCAIHGHDPNWGRIAAALGKSAAKVVVEKLAIRIGSIVVFKCGGATKFSTAAVGRHLSGTMVKILCNLGLGSGRFTALTCDLSKEYIEINAHYHT